MEGIKLCSDHSGHEARILSLEKENEAQWKGIEKVNDKFDKVLFRANVILGGVAVAIVLLLLNLVFVPHAKAATQTINPIPSANSTFISDVQTFLRNEQANREVLQDTGDQIKVISGGIGATSASLTHTISTVVAFPNGYYVTDASISHTYTASKRTFVYVRDSDTRTISDGVNTVTYDGNFVFIETAASSDPPSAKTGTLPLFYADTDETSITSITDRRFNSLRFVYPEWFGAVGDGVTDDTAEIKEAINTGSTVIFDNSKTYLISSELLISGSYQTIYLNGATIKLADDATEHIFRITGSHIQINGPGILDHNLGRNAAPGDDNAIFFDGASNVIVNKIKCQNIGCATSGTGGIRFDGASYITLNNVIVYNSNSNGIFGNGALNGANSYIYLNECIVDGTNAQNGIYFANDNNNIYVTKCSTFNITDGAIEFGNNPHIEYFDVGTYDIVCRDNYFESSNGVFISKVERVKFINNTVIGSGFNNIVIIHGARDIELNGNTYIQNRKAPGQCIQITNDPGDELCRNITIKNEKLYFKYQGINIVPSETKSVTIDNNTFSTLFWVLEEDISAVATTFKIQNFPGAILEATDVLSIGSELMTVVSYNESTGDLEVTRGTATTHSVGEHLYYNLAGVTPFGIYFQDSSDLDSYYTITNNVAYGVDSFISGGVPTLYNVTIANNSVYDSNAFIENTNITLYDSIITNNTIISPQQTAVGVYIGALYRCKIKDNKWMGRRGTAYLAGDSNDFDTAVPTSGSWLKGDTIVQLNPSVGNYAGWVVTISGAGTDAVWSSGTAYTAEQWISNSVNNVYRVITAGGGNSTVEPTHIEGRQTLADGYKWEYKENAVAEFTPYGLIEFSGESIWDPASLAVGAVTGFSVGVTYAEIGDIVLVGMPYQAGADSIIPFAFVGSANNITIRIFNAGTGAFDFTSDTWKYKIIKPQ